MIDLIVFVLHFSLQNSSHAFTLAFYTNTDEVLVLHLMVNKVVSVVRLFQKFSLLICAINFIARQF